MHRSTKHVDLTQHVDADVDAGADVGVDEGAAGGDGGGERAHSSSREPPSSGHVTWLSPPSSSPATTAGDAAGGAAGGAVGGGEGGAAEQDVDFKLAFWTATLGGAHALGLEAQLLLYQ